MCHKVHKVLLCVWRSALSPLALQLMCDVNVVIVAAAGAVIHHVPVGRLTEPQFPQWPSSCCSPTGSVGVTSE